MGKHAPKIEIRPEDRATLERWSRSKRISAQQHERAIMILESARGTPVKEIAAKLDTYSNKVIQWRGRYREQGVAGLADKPRKGRPKIYAGLRDRLLKKISEPPPEGFARWDAGLLAKETGASDDAIWRILKKEGISLHRQRSWCIGYFGVMTPPVSVKLRHFERSYNYKNNLRLYAL